MVLEHLKFALHQEVREWIVHYGQACNAKYRKEMNEVSAFIDDIEKRLSRKINDLEDIRLVMIAIKDLRENEIRIDMSITPIDESYTMLQAHGLSIAREEIERSESLKLAWEKLQRHCVSEAERNLLEEKRTFLLLCAERSDVALAENSAEQTQRIAGKRQSFRRRMFEILRRLQSGRTEFARSDASRVERSANSFSKSSGKSVQEIRNVSRRRNSLRFAADGFSRIGTNQKGIDASSTPLRSLQSRPGHGRRLLRHRLGRREHRQDQSGIVRFSDGVSKITERSS